ncbi:MAG: signal peptidase II [Thermodesulfobacteriota bacterium]
MRPNKWTLAALAAGGLVTADQISKLAVQAWLAPVRRIQIVPGFFDLRYILNPGVAFGLFAESGSDYRVLGLIAVALLALAVMILLLALAKPHEKILIWGLALAAGGAGGNVIDRSRLGAVVDFLDFHIGRNHWPAFNVADIGISVGLGLILIHLWKNRKE